MRVTPQTLALLLSLTLLGACGRDPIRPEDRPIDGLPDDAVVVPANVEVPGLYSDQLVVVDPAVLLLVSTAEERGGGTYRYRVLASEAPDLVPGDVLYDASDTGYMRRVVRVERDGNLLVAHTSSAFPHEVVRGGAYHLSTSAAPRSGVGGAALSSELIGIVDTFDLKQDLCARIADSLGVQVCNKDRTLVDKGWVEIEGRIDSLEILSGELIVEGKLDASYVVDAGGELVPGTGRPPVFYPCNVAPNAVGCLARTGGLLRSFLQSVGLDPNLLPPARVCIPGTLIVLDGGSLFPFRAPVVRVCRITDFGELPDYTLPGLASVTLAFVPKITITNLDLKALASATIKLSIPVPKLAVVKCFNHGNGFLCLKAGVIIVIDAGFVQAGGRARFDGFRQDRVSMTWTPATGWQEPVLEALESDQDFAFLPDAADSIRVRIGPAGVLEAVLCFGPNVKSSCVDETTGRTPDSDEGKGWLFNLNIGVTGKLQLGSYFEGTWSRDATRFDNWHMPIDLYSEVEVEFGIQLPKILLQLPDKNLKTDIDPLRWGQTTISSLHGTGILQVNATTTAPPDGLDGYNVTVVRKDTLPVLQPTGTARLGAASWEYPLSGTVAPNGTTMFEPTGPCQVAYSDALFTVVGGTAAASLVKGARRLGIGIPNYQLEAGCQLLIADYFVALEDVPDGCVVIDGAVKPVQLTQFNLIRNVSRTKLVEFEVDCSVPTGPPGDLVITTMTTGPNQPTGYRYRLDGRIPEPILATDEVTLTGVGSRNDRVLRLEGLPANCAVTGNNPLLVDVVAGGHVVANFNVACGGVQTDAASPGTLTVRVATTGAPGDPDGYAVAIDGADPTSIASSGQVAFTGVNAGQHVVALTGVADGCRVSGETVRTVQLPSGGSMVVEFGVECDTAEPGEATGSVTVTVTTSGHPPDADGYQVQVGSFFAEVSANDEVTVDQLAVGTADVKLAAVAAHCHVEGDNPRSVSIEAGNTTAISMSVRCEPLAAVWFTVTTTGVDIDPDGYTILVNGRATKAIPANGAVAITGLVPASTGLALAGLAPNCTTVGEHPATVELQAGVTASTYVDVVCIATERLGSLDVVLRTSGGSLAAGGVTLLVDGVERGNIVAGNPVHIPGVHAGNHEVELGDLPAGWVLGGTVPRSVRVQLGQRVTVELLVVRK